MSVSTLLIGGDTRKPLDSVGIVCTCGKAVASIEGVARACVCGRVWIVTAMLLRGPSATDAPDAERV